MSDSGRVERPIRLLTYFGTYDATYVRNRTLIIGLRLCGVEVQECHADLYGGTDGKLRAARGDPIYLVKLLLRAVKAQLTLIYRFLRMPPGQAVLLGYSAQADVFLAWVLTRLRGGFLVTDIMTPMWLICLDRYGGRVPRITRLIVRALERTAIRLSDLCLVETAEVAQFLAEQYNVSSSRFGILPVGAHLSISDEGVPQPEALIDKDAFVALYQGKFIPQHGISTILEAARILQGYEDLLFVLAGDGQDSQRAREFISSHNLRNVRQLGQVTYGQVAALIRRADVCLGVFGTSFQSRITAHNKIFEALALGKPLISGRSAPIERLFRDGEELLLVERGNGQALADAILRVKADPGERQKLTAGATRALDRGGFRPVPLAEHLLALIRERRPHRTSEPFAPSSR